MKAAKLSDRGLVRVSGPDARGFLQGLVTGNVQTLEPGEARWAALLSPQGKILFDFLMSAADDAVLLDVKAEQAADLVKRLTMYKLRAQVEVANETEKSTVIALYGGPVAEGARDSRHPDMGARLIVAAASADATLLTLGGDHGLADYAAHRIALGVPEGGVDFAYGDAFPAEADMDLFNGVDFKKGCFVGQEVVARMHYRATVRTRVTKVLLEGVAPPPGETITAGDKAAGTMGSSAGGVGLALLRLDRVEEATQAGLPLKSGETVLRLA
ncbi:folate-binding protein YgfZ [Rhodoblastus acidophilus]|uniref:CAF17-like 4Fe-4S cluster assembly/insertion protein YgfZ n=1 Tax=Rhodoblastus acidophilus TaxID=1074 RepID=UPI0022255E61|nr:folate-binding protein [Rhodoblastus acidophilus]MCW2316311.1 folate-binding protein YgfZ [Rhodoblastus acidophilus]